MKNNGIEPIHLASQYLAAAGISFVEKRDDDSHTNLGFSVEDQYLFTRPLIEAGDFLVLNLTEFALEWIGGSVTSILPLEKRSHKEVLEWIRLTSLKAGLSQTYKYNFHYSLPYDITADYVFNVDPQILALELKLRTQACQVLSEVLNEHSMKSEIRIWPHHFDTGAFGLLPGADGLSLGMGLAIPDIVNDGHYFYLSGYRQNKPIDTNPFKALNIGQWSQGDFKGAILDAKGITKADAVQFFNEAISTYKG